MEIKQIFTKVKTNTQAIIQRVKQFIDNNNIEILISAGVALIVTASFLLRQVLGLYILGLILIGLALFMLKFPRK